MIALNNRRAQARSAGSTLGRRHPIDRLGIRARRLTARHRRWYWPLITALGALTILGVHRRAAELDKTQQEWRDTVTVWVARTDLVPGDAIADNVDPIQMPAAVAPPTALTAPTGVIGQAVDAGTALTAADAAPGLDDLALVPDGWGAIAVVEDVASGAVAGDRVGVISEGLMLVGDAIVVDASAERTLLAIPPGSSEAVAAANASGSVTLIRWPAR